MPEKVKHAFRRLTEAPKAVIEQVDTRLLKGDTPSAVAAWLQTECHLFVDLKPNSLKKNLERYRAIDLKDRVIAELTAGSRGKSVAGIKKRLNALDEQELLVAIQKGRVEKLLVQETKLPNGIVLKQASDEIRLLKEQLVELGKLQLETGVLARAPKKVTGSVMGDDGQVKHFEWTEEQDQLFRTLEDIDYSEVPEAIEDASEPANAV